ncbi:conserved hypothetical protein, partial [delta proteobacterium NaphS2]
MIAPSQLPIRWLRRVAFVEHQNQNELLDTFGISLLLAEFIQKPFRQ